MVRLWTSSSNGLLGSEKGVGGAADRGSELAQVEATPKVAERVTVIWKATSFASLAFRG
jgi:hypothetical protein